MICLESEYLQSIIYRRPRYVIEKTNTDLREEPFHSLYIFRTKMGRPKESDTLSRYRLIVAVHVHGRGMWDELEEMGGIVAGKAESGMHKVQSGRVVMTSTSI